MRKSTIWLLAVVMAFAFAGLLYLQINYVSIILKTRSEQFNETVKRSLRQVSKNLELDETRKYLEDDINRDETNFMYQNAPDAQSLGQVINHEKYQLQIKDSNGTVQQIEMQSFSAHKFEPLSSLSKRQSANSIVNTSKDLQKTLKRRYQYQGGLIEEVIYNILYTANLKPIEERIDFKKLNNYLKTEFINNGLNLPFVFSVINKDGNVVYQSGEFQKQPIASDVITQVLFPNDPPSKLNYLRVYFPTKGDYISSSITFIVPSVIFSLILLITFVFTILHRIPSEEVIRDEKRLYQQHDARVEDTGIHDLARRPDVEGFGYNEESGRIQAYIRRNQRRDEAIELLGRESATDVFVRTTESSA